MTKGLRYLSFISFLFLLPSIVFGAGFGRTGLGAKSNAMGGAFRAVADDYTAAYWNPAGLGQLENSTVGLIGDFIWPRLKYTPNTGRTGYEDGLEIGNKSETLFAPGIGGFYKMDRDKKRLVYGVGIYNTFGSTTEWNTYTPPAGYSENPEIENFPEFNRKSALHTIDIHPALGVRFSNKISAGIGISFQYGKVNLVRTALKSTGFSYAPYDYVPVDSDMEADGWGIGFNGGILFTPNRKLRVALTGRTGNKMKLSGTAKLTAFMPTTRDSTFLNSAAGALFNGAVIISEPNAKADLTSPAELAIGLAYKINDKLLVAMDVSQTYWRAAFDVMGIEIDGVEDSSKVYAQFDDTIRLSFGMEYAMNPKLKLRAGYYFDETAVPNESYVPTWTDVGDRNVLSVGFAHTFGSITFEADYQYTMFDDRTVVRQTYADYDVSGEGVKGTEINLPGEYSGTPSAVHTSLIYSF